MIVNIIMTNNNNHSGNIITENKFLNRLYLTNNISESLTANWIFIYQKEQQIIKIFLTLLQKYILIIK